MAESCGDALKFRYFQDAGALEMGGCGYDQICEVLQRQRDSGAAV